MSDKLIVGRIQELTTENSRLREANRRLQVVGPALERDKLIMQLRAELELARRVADAAAVADMVFNARCKLDELGYTVDDDASDILLRAENAAQLAVESAVREYRARVEAQEKENNGRTA